MVGKNFRGDEVTKITFQWLICGTLATLKNDCTMSYNMTKAVSAASLDEAIDKVTAALKEQGFGVLTTIDMKATLKAKIDKDIAPYTILGACNPKFAGQALDTENNIGVFLPCNVVVKQAGAGFEAVAVDPIASMQAIENDALHAFAGEVKGMLEDALASLN
jgi:uncharacterized protein (DUF302 family)